jgi:hypothetical protein
MALVSGRAIPIWSSCRHAVPAAAGQHGLSGAMLRDVYGCMPPPAAKCAIKEVLVPAGPSSRPVAKDKD